MDAGRGVPRSLLRPDGFFQERCDARGGDEAHHERAEAPPRIWNDGAFAASQSGHSLARDFADGLHSADPPEDACAAGDIEKLGFGGAGAEGRDLNTEAL